MSPESVSRTFIGSVVCVDLVGYSTKSVAQQIEIKQAFNRLLGQGLEKVPPEDRIILDTGDGAAISFLGDPEATLAVGLALRDSMAKHATELGRAEGDADQGAVRIGINLGPVRLSVDLNGYPKIIGDGLNVAERITSFAQPGQIAVSRSFFDMVSRLSEANAALFRFEGVRTDKNAREHQIYVVDAGAGTAEPAAATSRPAPQSAASPANAAGAATADRGALVAFLEDRFKVGFAAMLLVALIVAESVLLALQSRSPGTRVAAAPAKAPAAAPAPAPASVPVPVPVKPAPILPVVPVPAATSPPKSTEPAVAAKVPAAPPAKAPEAPAKPAEPKAPATVAPVKPPETKAAPSEPAKPAARRDEPAKPEPARPERRKAEEPALRVAPLQTPLPALDTTKSLSRPAPMATPAPPPEPPREEPKPAPAPAPTLAANPIARSAVNFPAAAAAKNIDTGTVKARLTIDAAGHVKNVQILESRPRRYFDEEAARSLREWRFNPGADNRAYEVEIAFQR